MSRRIEYVIDKDERGEFAATVYDGDTIVAAIDNDDATVMVEACGVQLRDYGSVRSYLEHLGIVDRTDTFTIVG